MVWCLLIIVVIVSDSSANEDSTLVMQSKPKTEEQAELGR